MAFPSSPTNGQIYNNYKYNSTLMIWRHYDKDTYASNATQGSIAADGTWHSVLAGLSGRQAFDIVAEFGTSGKHSMGRWTAVNTYATNYVTGNSTNYNGSSGNIQVQWVGTTYDVDLQIRSTSSLSGVSISYRLLELYS